MKKITLIASLVGICTSAFAQRVSNAAPYTFQQLGNVVAQRTTQNDTHKNARVTGTTPFYTQDFSGGMPAGWTVGNTNVSFPTANFNWRISHSTAGRPFGTPGFKSATAANGYLVFAYDSLSNANPSQYQTQPYPIANAYVTTGNIDCSAHTSVVLKFSQFFRWIIQGTQGKDAMRLDVSGDGGTTWTPYSIMDNVPSQTVSNNPDMESINITPTAGGSNQVQLRFTYNANYYFWCIDDISLQDADPDIAIATPYYNFGNPASTNPYTSYSGIYGSIPSGQALDTIRLGAAIYNNGPSDQANVQLNGSIVNTTTNTVFSQTTSTGTTVKALTKGGTFTANADTQFVFVNGPKATGSYTMNIRTIQSADVDSANNIAAPIPFNITDSTYARDNGIVSSTMSTTDYIGGKRDGFEILNLFELSHLAFANSVDVYLEPNATASYTNKGALFTVVIYQYTPGFTLSPTAINLDGIIGNTIAQSQPYTITSNAKGFVKVKFGGALLQPGPYWVGIHCNESTIDTTTQAVTIGNDVLTPQANISTILTLVDNGGNPHQYNLGGNNSPFIRLELVNTNAGIAQPKANNLFKLYQNRPNPTNGLTTIGYTLANNANVSVEVCDVTGKVVMQMNEGNRSAGDYSFSIDGNKLGNGVYFYTLRAGDYKETLRMVVAQ